MSNELAGVSNLKFLINSLVWFTILIMHVEFFSRIILSTLEVKVPHIWNSVWKQATLLKFAIDLYIFPRISTPNLNIYVRLTYALIPLSRATFAFYLRAPPLRYIWELTHKSLVNIDNLERGIRRNVYNTVFIEERTFACTAVYVWIRLTNAKLAPTPKRQCKINRIRISSNLNSHRWCLSVRKASSRNWSIYVHMYMYIHYVYLYAVCYLR